MNITTLLIYVALSISINALFYQITYGLWHDLIHETLVEQMAGAGLAEKIVFGFTDVVGFASFVGGIGFTVANWIVTRFQE